MTVTLELMLGGGICLAFEAVGWVVLLKWMFVPCSHHLSRPLRRPDFVLRLCPLSPPSPSLQLRVAPLVFHC